MSDNNRKAITAPTRKAAELIHLRIKESALTMNEATQYWGGKDDRYFEGFEDGLNATRLHIEDAIQAFFDKELLEEVLG